GNRHSPATPDRERRGGQTGAVECRAVVIRITQARKTKTRKRRRAGKCAKAAARREITCWICQSGAAAATRPRDRRRRRRQARWTASVSSGLRENACSTPAPYRFDPDENGPSPGTAGR